MTDLDELRKAWEAAKLTESCAWDDVGAANERLNAAIRATDKAYHAYVEVGGKEIDND